MDGAVGREDIILDYVYFDDTPVSTEEGARSEYDIKQEDLHFPNRSVEELYEQQMPVENLDHDQIDSSSNKLVNESTETIMFRV